MKFLNDYHGAEVFLSKSSIVYLKRENEKFASKAEYRQIVVANKTPE